MYKGWGKKGGTTNVHLKKGGKRGKKGEKRGEKGGRKQFQNFLSEHCSSCYGPPIHAILGEIFEKKPFVHARGKFLFIFGKIEKLHLSPKRRLKSKNFRK